VRHIGYDYEIFEDAGISGKSIEKRESLQEMLHRLKEFDIVLCYKLSRISRSVQDMANMLDVFKKTSTRFISYKENIDTEQTTR